MDRYTIFSGLDEIGARFNVQADKPLEPIYNAGPTLMLPVIANMAKGGLSHFYWGAMAKWSNNKSISPRLILANKKELKAKASLKSALEARRCLIPANGFYLWKMVGKKSRRPYYFQFNNQNLFAFAGIWEQYDDIEGKVHHTFRILTTYNELSMPEFGDTVPIVLNPEHEAKWLNQETDSEDLQELLTPLTMNSSLSFHCVSPHISDLRNNNVNLLNPQPPVDQAGNYTLFE